MKFARICRHKQAMVDNVELAVQLREARCARFRVLADKASLDPTALSLEELDEICTLVVQLGPTNYVLPPKSDAAPEADPNEAFQPLKPAALHPDEAQARLRQAHAWEYIAAQLGKLAR